MNISSCKTCYNCGLCYNICPHQAISVMDDGLFYTPTVDFEKCTDCGLCYNRCPINNVLPGFSPITAYGGWHNNPKILKSSSSGGVFYGLANAVLEQGGIVYGAVYSDDCKSVAFASTEDVALEYLQKSKYVESLVGDTFRKIAINLSKGKKILFCGTPCQCAGLRSFLGQSYDNLIICDFACGGLPSHQIYHSYLSDLEHRYGASVQSIDFRPKTHGWRRYAVLAKFKNGKVYNRLGSEDPYLRSFLYGKLTVRDNCLDCKFSNCHHSDLTIADFWLNDQFTTMRNPNGISLILCNTGKGALTIESIRKEYYLEMFDPVMVSYNNKETITSDHDRARHDSFIQLFIEKGLKHAYRKMFPFSWKKLLKSRITRIIRRHS